MTVGRRLVGALKSHADNVQGLSEIFKTLGDPTRLRILAALCSGPLCVHELCEALDISQPAVSHQLRVLRAARLVRPRRDGREMIYSIDDAHVMVLLEEGLKHAGHGRGGRTR
jgi:DNA-binding transcriptional ArsR family regulator